MSSWMVIGVSVPDENIYIDPILTKQMLKDKDFNYNTHINQKKMTKDMNHPSNIDMKSSRTQIIPSKKDNINSSNKQDNVDELQSNHSSNDDHINEETDGDIELGQVVSFTSNKKPNMLLSNKNNNNNDNIIDHEDIDLEYIVQSVRKHHYLKDNVIIPPTHETIPLLSDWDRNRLKKSRNSKSNDRRNSIAQSDSGGGWGTSTVDGKSNSIDNNNDVTRSIHSNEQSIFSAILNRGKERINRETRWKICRFAEILMSKEMADSCATFKWKLSEFKKFNRLSSVSLGKTAQNLALVCNLSAPPGFVRVSDWSLPPQTSNYDLDETKQVHMIVKGIVAITSTIEDVTERTTDLLTSSKDVIPMMLGLKGRSKLKRKTKSLSKAGTTGREITMKRMFSDRVVQYFSEALVSSTSRIDLDDSELSYNGRIGWRAIARSLRRKYCAFIVPSLFVQPKPLTITHLILTKNDLDCGDAVYLSDIFTHQMSLIMVDLSCNRIGARGMSRMAIALRDHPCMEVFKIDNNIIGYYYYITYLLILS